MSYRAFKRLLGEYRLERKCRFSFGFFIVITVDRQFLALRLADRIAGLRSDQDRLPAHRQRDRRSPAGR